MFWINPDKWLKKYSGRLCGKRVALFGSTGGIGNILCRYILRLGGGLITVDRNPEKASSLKSQLEMEFPDFKIYTLTANLEDLASVEAACQELERLGVDIIIHNAGAYRAPRSTCSTGYDNVYQINCASPYYITKRLLTHLAGRQGKVVVVGSIAHGYSKTDPIDIDFSTRKKPSLVYGNAKRRLMFSSFKLMNNNPKVKLAVTHPGITLTNITAHYPKWLFAIIKHPMRIIFMPPKAAALSIVEGIFSDTESYSWIGPCLFNIWGKPAKKPLKTCRQGEIEQIYKAAEQGYNKMSQI